MLAAGELGEVGHGRDQEVEQAARRVQAHLVEAVETAQECDLTRAQPEAFTDVFDRHGLGGKMDGDCRQCGHPG
ncbi:hypothetical protein GCM10009665_56380 [Kitasatospora nipponensis]|uniref:Uncharacterized protein n=1 Tax=Kitasatospora nipponensis TaxID=258049 RepID=A0ABN1WPG4_9ACTN